MGRGRKVPAPFAFLWAAQFLSQLGDSIFQIAFVWLVLDLTGSKSATGVAATVSYLPALLFGLAAGLLVDRWDRRIVMAGADAGRALLLALAGVFLWNDLLSPTLLTAIAFGMATSAVLFNPARDSLLPEIVPAASLTKANAWVQSSQQAAFLFGPLAAGVLIQWGGVKSTLPAGVLLFGGSLLLLIAIKGVGRAHRSGHESLALGEDFRRGLKAIASDRTLVLLLVLTALDNMFIMGPAILGNVVIVRETLRGSASDYALVEAIYGVGMIAGSFLIAKVGSRIPSGWLVLIGITLDGITYIPMLWCRTLPYLLVFSLIHSLAIPIITVPRVTILQRIVPPSLVGRVFALQNVVVVGVTALSCGVAGLLLETVSAPMLFAVGGGLGAATGLLGALSPRLRRL
jgi:DHA3 family macrolide efflux protein-like MFS transporter